MDEGDCGDGMQATRKCGRTSVTGNPPTTLTARGVTDPGPVPIRVPDSGLPMGGTFPFSPCDAVTVVDLVWSTGCDVKALPRVMVWVTTVCDTSGDALLTISCADFYKYER